MHHVALFNWKLKLTVMMIVWREIDWNWLFYFPMSFKTSNFPTTNIIFQKSPFLILTLKRKNQIEKIAAKNFTRLRSIWRQQNILIFLSFRHSGASSNITLHNNLNLSYELPMTIHFDKNRILVLQFIPFKYRTYRWIKWQCHNMKQVNLPSLSHTKCHAMP